MLTNLHIHKGESMKQKVLIHVCKAQNRCIVWTTTLIFFRYETTQHVVWSVYTQDPFRLNVGFILIDKEEAKGSLKIKFDSIFLFQSQGGEEAGERGIEKERKRE